MRNKLEELRKIYNLICDLISNNPFPGIEKRLDTLVKDALDIAKDISQWDEDQAFIFMAGIRDEITSVKCPINPPKELAEFTPPWVLRVRKCLMQLLQEDLDLMYRASIRLSAVENYLTKVAASVAGPCTAEERPTGMTTADFKDFPEDVKALAPKINSDGYIWAAGFRAVLRPASHGAFVTYLIPI